MGYIVEWDPKKAESNARNHDLTFEEASTVFGDLALLMPDPDHSLGEQRYLVLGMSDRLCRTATAHPTDLSKAGHATRAEAS